MIQTPTLTAAHLNRATLARQLLLRREAIDPLIAIERLAGLRAEHPQTWYVGLWGRLAPFDPRDAGELLGERRAVRIALMRGRVHVVSSADALWMRPLLAPVVTRGLSRHANALRDLDMPALTRAARAFLESEPRTAPTLGARLAERFPGRDPSALARAAAAGLGLVEVPPRGMWGRSASASHTTIEKWLARPQSPAPPMERLVVRYLAAFGPATAADFRAWCGLDGVEEVFEGLRHELTPLRGEDGVEYLDVPEGPRPEPDTPAPTRLLYEHDNLLAAHADRRRFESGRDAAEAWGHDRSAPGAVLVDGVVRGRWSLRRDGDRVIVNVRHRGRLNADRRADVVREAGDLLSMVAPSAEHDVRLRAG